MTDEEARQLSDFSRGLGDLTVAVVNARIAVGKLEERVNNLLHLQKDRDRACQARHEQLDLRIAASDIAIEKRVTTTEHGLLGFQSRFAGAGALVALLATVLGVVLSTGRILGLY